MKKLSEKKLKNTYGGVSVWAVLGTLAAIIFGVGVVDGQIKLK